LGSIWGSINLLGAFGMAGGPLLVGWLVDRTGSYTAGFELCAALALIGAFGTMLMSPAVRLKAISSPAIGVASNP
jgi:cyanate permease